MATIDDFGGSGQSLSSPKLGGPDGWAAAVRDKLREIEDGLPTLAFEVTALAEGSEPTISQETVAGVTTVTIGIPDGATGNTGPTPEITATVSSGPLAVSISGTPEEPSIDLVIPPVADPSGVVTAGTARADALTGWGHSYVEGAGIGVTSESRFIAVLAQMLGLPLRSNGVGGATVHTDFFAGGGGAPTVIDKTSSKPARFAAPTGVHVTMWGLNDLNKLGNTAGHLAPLKASYRAVISRLRQGRVFESQDASVAFGGVYWQSAPSLGGGWAASGDSVHYATDPWTSGTITITTPKDFPGGTVALGFVSHIGGGAVFSTTVNAVTYTIDTRVGSLADRKIPQVLRIPNVGAGVRTITITVGAYTNTGGALPAIFDYWAWEPDDDDGPVVVLVKQPKPLDYTAYGATAPGPPTDTGVDNLNTILDDLAAEFGERVIAVDTSGIDKNAAWWDAGNVHPNANGNRYIAEQVRDAILAVATPVLAGDQRQPRHEYGTAAPTGAQTIYAKGDMVWNTAPAEAGSNSSKYVTLGWVCTVAGAPGTWLPMRALTGN